MGFTEAEFKSHQRMLLALLDDIASETDPAKKAELIDRLREMVKASIEA